MRVAAVDLGTNTTRLLVADVDDGDLEEVVRREEITRLGESVDRRRILLPTAIARVRNVLVDYRREAERLGAERVLAVGTSAVRDADNGEAFLGEVEWSYGFTTRLLDGGEEAEMMLRGVASDRAVAAGHARRRHRRRLDGARPHGRQTASRGRTAPMQAASGSRSGSSTPTPRRTRSSPPVPSTSARSCRRSAPRARSASRERS